MTKVKKDICRIHVLILTVEYYIRFIRSLQV